MTQADAAPLPETAPDAKPEKRKEDSFFVFLIKLVVIVTLIRSFVFAPFNIPSESMLPRLYVGDYLVVAKWPWGFSKHSLPFSVPLIPGRIFASLPTPGDVAVFKAPPGNHTDYIKRVIGLPGDFIQMRDGQLFINDTPVKKERIADLVMAVSPNTQCAPDFTQRHSDGRFFCHYPRYRETLPNGRSYDVLDQFQSPALPDNSEVYQVPEGHLFMMGDNRDASADSRFPAEEGKGVGFVPVENLVGRAWFMMFSTDGSAQWLLPWTWFSAARWERIGGSI